MLAEKEVIAITAFISGGITSAAPNKIPVAAANALKLIPIRIFEIAFAARVIR